MRKFTCSPTLELLGQNISAWITNLKQFETAPIMEKYGLANLDPDKWYPCHLWMSTLNDMVQVPNVAENFVAIGMEVGKIVPMPPGVENPDLPQVLMLWDGLYQFIHRNGDAGKIVCEKVGEKHYKTIHTDLYPDDFTYGIVYAYARRFLPPKTHFKVFYDEQITPRDQGGNGTTVIHVTWE